MRQLTVRGFDKELARRLRGFAATHGISLAQAAIRLMRRGAGLSEVGRPNVVGDSLDRFIGTWSDEEADEFSASIASTEQIDGELWR